MKILIVEDEPEMLDILTGALAKEGALVETAADFSAALDKVTMYQYDCILLDINLPGGSGLQVLEALRKLGKSDGVLIISARDAIDDKVAGLDLGADDYLTKPFHITELIARLKSIVRRKQFNGRSSIGIGNVTIYPEEREVVVADNQLQLNRKEYEILLYFAANKDRLVHKTALAEHVWGDHIDEADNFEFIYSQIKNLRKKLKDTGAGIEIQAVYGIGYKMIVE